MDQPRSHRLKVPIFWPSILYRPDRFMAAEERPFHQGPLFMSTAQFRSSSQTAGRSGCTRPELPAGVKGADQAAAALLDEHLQQAVSRAAVAEAVAQGRPGVVREPTHTGRLLSDRGWYPR